MPALILCTNPAINYTVYEVLKGLALSSSTSSLWPQPTQQTTIIATRQQTKKILSMQQSFIFGLLSKFIATVLTYPLVRCKVMLMVNNCPYSSNSLILSSSSPASSSSSRNRTTAAAAAATTTTTRIKSFIQLLQYIYKYDGGVYGLYRGCDIQLLHVLLKGALMMMIRERIQQVLGSIKQTRP